MSSPARSDYLDNATLSRLIRDHRSSGVISDELGLALLALAGGIWDRYRFTREREEFVSEVVIHLLQRPLALADVQKHIFNYLTTCAIRFGWKLRDREHGDQRRWLTYAEELLDAGRELPDLAAT